MAGRRKRCSVPKKWKNAIQKVRMVSRMQKWYRTKYTETHKFDLRDKRCLTKQNFVVAGSCQFFSTALFDLFRFCVKAGVVVLGALQ